MKIRKLNRLIAGGLAGAATTGIILSAYVLLTTSYNAILPVLGLLYVMGLLSAIGIWCTAGE